MQSSSSSEKKVVVVAAVPQSNQRRDTSSSSSHGGGGGSGGFASKWAWVLIILLCLAVIGLAIGLGVVASDDDDIFVPTCSPGGIDSTEIGDGESISRRPYNAPDPFEAITDVDMKSQMVQLWERTATLVRYNQLTQLTSGYYSGPEQISDDAVYNHIKNGLVGSVFNVNQGWQANLFQNASVEANGMPLIVGYDTIHGYKTIFPMNIGMAASFNETMHERHAEIAGRETRAHGIHLVFAPMLDIARDSRWGRMSESCGESPYLTGKLGAAVVKGFQTAGVMPCIKHFAAYGAGTAGRDYNPADMSMQSLYNEYLPAYRTAFEAGKDKPISFMASFNTINNVPAHANRWLLSELLRGDWGFDGMVLADYTGIPELLQHSLGTTGAEVLAKAIYSGVDMEMAGAFVINHVQEAVSQGLITDETLSIAAKRVMKAKLDLGLLPVNEETLYVSEDESTYGWVNDEALKAAREAGRQSVILLKNKEYNGVSLPLSKTDMKAGVIGYMAASPHSTVGSWAGQPRVNDTVTFTNALAEALGGPFATTTDMPFAFEPGFVRAFEPTTDVPNCVYQLNASLPLYNVMVPPDWHFMGRNITTLDTDETPGIVYPCTDGELKTNALTLASDPTVTHLFVYLGESHSGGFQMSGEATSRSDLDIPKHQVELLNEVLEAAKTGTNPKHVTLIVSAGRGMSIEDQQANANIDAILYVWTLGTESGHSITDLIFDEGGVAATGFGRAPITFPRNVGQCPIYGEHMATGRPAITNKDWGNVPDDNQAEVKYKSRYIDVRWSPLYPFGFGLTYTTFKYESVSVTPTSYPATAEDSSFQVTCAVKNTGGKDGTEVVQLYYRQPSSKGVSVRPVRVLCGFQRVLIKTGETKSVTFNVPVKSLGFYNENMDFVIEQSKYEFYCSPNVENRDVSDFVDPLQKLDVPIWGNYTTPYTTLLPPSVVTLS